MPIRRKLISMQMNKAITLAIADTRKPVVTIYDLGRIFFDLYTKKKYKSEPIEIQKKEEPNFVRMITHLENAGILEKGKLADSAYVYATLSRENASAADIACSIDPFAYVSHLSAMEWHGLTDRIPKTLFLSSPAPADWKRSAAARMIRDLGEEGVGAYSLADLPPLKRYAFSRIRRTVVHRTVSSHLGAFIAVKGTPLRVATIGRTFLDMLRTPDQCGGLRHVLEILERDAGRYLDLIVSEFNTHGRKIDRVRAGYIFEERLKLPHPAFDRWLSDVQRGGSRKLDPGADYAPEYSERWCLSINVEG